MLITDINEVLEANAGLCLDNEPERRQLALALTAKLTEANVSSKDGGLGELLAKVSMGLPVWPIDADQDVAMLAYMIHSLQEQVQELKTKTGPFHAKVEAVDRSVPMGDADEVVLLTVGRDVFVCDCVDWDEALQVEARVKAALAQGQTP
jgi:hypothetical protein